MSEYDQRQYRRMLDALIAFEEGNLRPGILLAELTGFLGVLENPDPSWERNFQNELGGVDEDLSVAIVRLESEADPAAYSNMSYDADTTARIHAAAARLKQLVLEKIENIVGDAQNSD